MTDLTFALVPALIFGGAWILDLLRVGRLARFAFGLTAVVLCVLAFIGQLRIETPKSWGQPLSLLLILVTMVAALRMAVQSVRVKPLEKLP